MTLDVRPCFEGKTLEIDGSLSLADLDFHGVRPFSEPVHIHGRVHNHAGILELGLRISTALHLVCDRCAEAFVRDLDYTIEATLVEALDNPDDDWRDDIFVLDGGLCDISEIATPSLILELDMKNLCREDCMGLCPDCGMNLNLGRCACSEKKVDPRLAKLAEYLNRNNQ